MSKETFYFPHDYEPTSDPKIQALLGEYGGLGYGVYWRAIEMLHSDKNHKLPLKEYIYLAIAKQMLASAEQIKAIIEFATTHCELLISDGEFVWSKRVNDNFLRREEISEKRALAGRAGAIAKQNLANTSKEKKKKEKKKKINNKEKDFVFVCPDWIKKETWDQFEAMRIKIKKPLTHYAAYLITLELQKIKEIHNHDPVEVLNQSIKNSYQDVYPLKNGGNNGNGNRSFGSKPEIVKKTGGAQSDGEPWPADRAY